MYKGKYCEEKYCDYYSDGKCTFRYHSVSRGQSCDA